MKKSVCKLISTAIACIFAFSLATGCAKKVPDTEDVLEIYIQELGYGKQWLYDAIELFKQEDWVKEKYPNLNIPEPNYNASYGYGNTLIKSGTTTTDLIFTMATDASLHTTRDERGEPYVASMNDLFESTVPGEDIKYFDKMFDSYVVV